MRWSDLLRMSLSSLKRRKLRTFLTVLGVIIGTASIVVMISLGLGLQQSMYEEVAQSGGTTSLTVTGKDSGSYYSFSFDSDEQEASKYITDDTIKSLKQLDHVKSADPVLNISAIVLKGKYEGYIDLYGMTQEALERKNLKLEPGGTLPDSKSGQLELVFGNQVLMNFNEKSTGKGYWETGEYPDIDLMNDQMFLILDTDTYYNSQDNSSFGNTDTSGSTSGGTTAASSQPNTAKKYVVHGSGLIAGGTDSYNTDSYSVFCDLTVLKSYLQKEFRGRAIPGQPTTASGKPYKMFVYTQANVQADDMKNVDELANEIRALGYNVTTNAELIDSMKSQFAMVQAVLGGIGAVSLLVAAIGIANTMMMSIYERTKEIGVMKVIGCSLKNIRQMFLIEAGFIGFLGGVAGNLLSALISVVINLLVSGESMGFSGNISYIPIWLVMLSMVFAVLVGMLAGYFPAVRAMRLSPLAAIRNE